MTWIWDHDLVVNESFFCCHSPTMSTRFIITTGNNDVS